MIVRTIISIFIVCFGLSCPGAAQDVSGSNLKPTPPVTATRMNDLSETVVPITELKYGLRLGPTFYPGLGGQAKFGTGFCLDPACRFVGTTYHFAAIARPHKIRGDRVIQRYLATGPTDDGATPHVVPGVGPMRYTLKRDLAIYELQHALPHHHGLAYSLSELQSGQAVNIYAYPLEGINPFRKLLRFPGTFKGKTPTGILIFDYTFSCGKEIRPGASGGIVVNSNTDQIIGILTEVGTSAAPIAMAVPIQALSVFVSKVQPLLGQELFPSASEKGVSPKSGDFYPEFVPPHADVLRHREKEPYEVSLLRNKAQLLVNSMRNFIAVQTLVWGSGDKELASKEAYEVRVIDGRQRYRRYPDSKKELKRIPPPPSDGWVVPDDEWSLLPNMVGTNVRLKIHQAPDVLLDKGHIKVFQYYAGVEDNVCPFEPEDDYVFFTLRSHVMVPCYGEVWTDENTNIIRISLHLDLSDKLKAYRGWDYYEVVLTYGWLKKANDPPRLIPLTIFVQGRNERHIFWCRGQFTHYQVFTASARLIRN